LLGQHPGNALEQCAFSRTIGPHHGGQGTLRKNSAHMVDRGVLAVADRQVVKDERRLAHMAAISCTAQPTASHKPITTGATTSMRRPIDQPTTLDRVARWVRRWKEVRFIFIMQLICDIVYRNLIAFLVFATKLQF
jgi:hypothetical protein